MKIFVAGTFDHFHVGHQWLLWQAAERADHLVIVVARDKTVERIKGFLPAHNEEERKLRIEKEEIAHAVVRLGNEDGDFMKTLKDEAPDLLWMGYDQFCPEEIQEVVKIQKCEPYFPEVFKSSYFRDSVI